MSTSRAESDGRAKALERASREFPGDVLFLGLQGVMAARAGDAARARELGDAVVRNMAEEQLAGRHGRTWKLGEAAYLAFKGPKRVVPLFNAPADRDKVLLKAQERLVATIDAIERGEFPPSPDYLYRC